MKKIAVCIKQVPDTKDIQWSKENNLVRDGMLSIVNPSDEFAIQIALKLKNNLKNVEIHCFSMGPLQAKNALEYALSLGADFAYLLTDKCFAASDTLATGRTIAHAIKSVADFDIIVCGQYAIDGDTAQTPPTIANFLEMENLCWVKDIEATADSEKLVITQETDDGYNKIEAEMPIVLSVLEENFEIKNPKIEDYVKAAKKEIKILKCEDISLLPDLTGIKGSPTFVSKVFRKQITRSPKITEEFCAKEFLEKLEKLKNGTN